ncbi:E3 ubiquitin-protein ligase ATL4-like [Lolium rigidum]|uniref:E3 ubiquitin-protein ligase ATL4-like n=1 Tax=Lolium rigidum TaxID=89674 RepID=UPI001F5D66F0|nr:E3 ubiquitin-protein ligase ATL4-like [Lolium rigidum]
MSSNGEERFPQRDRNWEPIRDSGSPTLTAISSLPLLTLTLAALAKGSADPDCAICLAALEPDTDLRLLPTCRHAACVGAWLRTNPFCPLCRAGISLPANGASANSGSFRVVDIGRISTSSAAGRRAYSLGGSFDYRVDDVEAVVARVAPRAGPQGPGDALAEAAGLRGWLRECVDRFSGRWCARWSRDESRRWDPEAAAAAAMPEDHGAGFMRWIFGT